MSCMTHSIYLQSYIIILRPLPPFLACVCAQFLLANYCKNEAICRQNRKKLSRNGRVKIVWARIKFLFRSHISYRKMHIYGKKHRVCRNYNNYFVISSIQVFQQASLYLNWNPVLRLYMEQVRKKNLCTRGFSRYEVLIAFQKNDYWEIL